MEREAAAASEVAITRFNLLIVPIKYNLVHTHTINSPVAHPISCSGTPAPPSPLGWGRKITRRGSDLADPAGIQQAVI